MVCFSHHTYVIYFVTCDQDVERLKFFYRENTNIESLKFTLASNKKWESTLIAYKDGTIRIKDLDNILLDMKGSTWSHCILEMGSQWVGISQHAVIPLIPREYLVSKNMQTLLNWIQAKNPKTNNWSDDPEGPEGPEGLGGPGEVNKTDNVKPAKEQLLFNTILKSISESYKSISDTYKRGHEVMKCCSYNLSSVEMHCVANFLIREHKVASAFFSAKELMYYFLERNRIICLSKEGLIMGHDIDFDLDDGFFPDAFQSENSYKDWNETFFAPWLASGKPCASPLPKLDVWSIVGSMAKELGSNGPVLDVEQDLAVLKDNKDHKDSKHVSNTTTTDVKDVKDPKSPTPPTQSATKVEPVPVKQETERMSFATKIENDWAYPLVYVMYQAKNKVGHSIYNDLELENSVKLFQKMAHEAGLGTVSRYDVTETSATLHGLSMMEYIATKYDQTIWTVCITHPGYDFRSSGGGSFNVTQSGMVNMLESRFVDPKLGSCNHALVHCESVPHGTRVFHIPLDTFNVTANFFIKNPLTSLKQYILKNKRESLEYINRGNKAQKS